MVMRVPFFGFDLNTGDVQGFDKGYWQVSQIPIPESVSSAMCAPMSYYLNLFTSQYQNSSNLLSWAEKTLNFVFDICSLVSTLDYEFDIDKANGKQLDILGLIIGQSRTMPFDPTGDISPVLTDDIYRILLKAKIAKNQWDGKIDSIQPVWGDIFQGSGIIVKDNQDMSMDVFISGNLSAIERDIIIHDLVIPRPEGVLINYNLGPYSGGALFGFDLDNEFIAGLDKGVWTHGILPPLLGFDQDNENVSGLDNGIWSNLTPVVPTQEKFGFDNKNAGFNAGTWN